MKKSGMVVLKKDEWVKIISPVIMTWLIAMVVSILMWMGGLMNNNLPTIIIVMAIVVIFLFIALFILIKFFSKPDNAITFHNTVEVEQINGKDMIRHQLYFDNNTNTNIPLVGSRYEVKRGDEILKRGGKRYPIFEETIISSIKNQSIDLGWVDPVEEGMSDREGHYIIDWKIAYIYEGATEILTSSCGFDWLRYTKDEKGCVKHL